MANKVKRVIGAILLFFASFIVPTAQAQSTTNYYSSSFEEKTLNAIADSINTNPLDLFYAAEYDSVGYTQMKEELEKMVTELKVMNLGKKSLKKQIKTIYNIIHSKWFKKYEEGAMFGDIISNGNYNCLTASAIYALVLRELNYNYVIKHTTNHVYIVVNPETEMIKMESTNPLDGVLFYDKSYKEMVVKYLKNNKLISEEEFKTKSIDELFNSYFLKDITISLTQLGALHYYNQGVNCSEREDYDQAAVAYEKAYNLYPESEFIMLAYSGSIGTKLYNETTKKIYNGATLGKLINVNANNQEVLLQAVDVFKSVTDEMLLRHPDVPKYKIYYEEMTEMIDDSVDIESIKWVYNYFLGINYYLNRKFDISIKYLSEAMMANPDDITTKNLMYDALINELSSSTTEELAFTKFEQYIEKYPIMMSYNEIREYYGEFLIDYMVMQMNGGKTEKAIGYLTKLENLVNEYDNMELDTSSIQTYFYQGFFYFADKNRKEEAITFLNRGLKLFPESDFLKGIPKMAGPRKKYEDYLIITPPKKQKTNEEIKIEKVKNFEEDFKSKFVGCWSSSYSYELDNESKHSAIKEKQQIKITKEKQIKFLKKGKEVNGKWSMRFDAKLLYLTPYNDPNDYIPYKVVKISDTELHVRIYVDGKLTNTVHVFTKCK